jgi:curved DNA-binding protein CbpA
MSSDDRLELLDYYTLLGVPRSATAEEVKRAFRTFARRFHPDRFAGQPAEKVERATRIYRRGSEAVQTLADLDARRAYDAGLAKGELRLKSDVRKGRAEDLMPAKPADAVPELAHVAGVTDRRAAPPAAAASTHGLHSPTARAFFSKAQQLARAGDLKGAWKQIKTAMEHEPGSPVLEAALDKVERAMRGW